MSGALRLSRLIGMLLGAGALGGIALPALVAGNPTSPGAAGSGLAALTWRAGPSPAAARPTPVERRAIDLLRWAAAAGRDRTYSGTQFVTGWSSAGTASVLVDVQHLPGRGMQVRLSGSKSSGVVVTDAGAAGLDPRAIAVLQRHYSLSVSHQVGQCAGRTAVILEARPRGQHRVAGRFWLDLTTGLVLRRELYDGSGGPVRAAAFIDLQMAAPNHWAGPSTGMSADEPRQLSGGQLVDLRRKGWRAPDQLAGALDLYDARWRDGVLHLSYSDGLFAVSVFSQLGRLNRDSVKGWQATTVGGTRVWIHSGLSVRALWTGGGHVYTAVADAPDAVVSSAVTGFPTSVDESFGHRLGRGLRRMGSWLDPTS